MRRRSNLPIHQLKGWSWKRKKAKNGSEPSPESPISYEFRIWGRRMLHPSKNERINA